MENYRRGGGHVRRGGSRKKRSKTRRLVLRYVFLAFSALLVLTVLVGLATLLSTLLTRKVNADPSYKFADSVIVNGIDISDKTYSEVYGQFASEINNEIVTTAITLRDGSSTFVITAADIGLNCDLSGFLDKIISGKLSAGGNTEYTVDDEKLRTVITTAAELFDTAAEEPFAVADKYAATPTFIYNEGKNGKALDQSKLFDTIIQCVRDKKLCCELEPEFSVVYPTLTVDDVKSNTVLRSSFSTSYGSSSSLKTEPRKHNILKTARKLNGCLVEVGVLWSFNGFIGPRTYDGGWEAAPGIVNGNTYEMQAGGGICQVSTTLHNALMLAGPEMEFKQRKNHSWPSSYVEYGLDATVSTGGPDLQFINNTGSDLYIFAYADHSTYTMTIYIYGEPLPKGITYNVYSEIKEELIPEDDLIIEEPTWKKGRTEVTVKSRTGYVTEAYRETLRDGVVIATDKLYSYTYRAVRGEKHVGTGE